ncbi:MAG: thioredoxin [Proteobacteria bacterium]|nr:thioredoxin [Pseudomonadota bacterium]
MQPATEPCADGLIVACLCAQWCSVCRQWKASFESLATQFHEACWVWVDVEDKADVLGDFEPDDFPVLAVQRGAHLLFCATLPQQTRIWQRLIEELGALDQTQVCKQAERLGYASSGRLDLRRLTSSL